jgi:hypothetical protein
MFILFICDENIFHRFFNDAETVPAKCLALFYP